MRILVTRPGSLSENLCEKIQTLGFEPILFPLITLSATSNQETLLAAIKTLDTVDLAIFISQAAAQYGMKAIRAYWPTLPTLQWLAMGPGTQRVLQDYGISDVLIPHDAPFETENLLKLPALQQPALAQKTIFIFRGNGGRNLLSETLQERAANLKVIETYQRTLPDVVMTEHLKMWQKQPLDAIIITSRESLENLVQLVGPQDWGWISEVAMIVVGRRLFTIALNMGVKNPILALGADDDSLLHALTHLEKEIS